MLSHVLNIAGNSVSYVIGRSLGLILFIQVFFVVVLSLFLLLLVVRLILVGVLRVVSLVEGGNRLRRGLAVDLRLGQLFELLLELLGLSDGTRGLLLEDAAVLLLDGRQRVVLLDGHAVTVGQVVRRLLGLVVVLLLALENVVHFFADL